MSLQARIVQTLSAQLSWSHFGLRVGWRMSCNGTLPKNSAARRRSPDAQVSDYAALIGSTRA